MKDIPRAAFWMGYAGLIPFVFGALVAMGAIVPFFDPRAFGFLSGPDRLFGLEILVRFGTIVACFMAGILWGFATHEKVRTWMVYPCSIAPALWVFFTVRGITQDSISALIGAFILVLLVDLWFHRLELVPNWWFALRVPLTLLVIACLAFGYVA